MKRLDVTVIQSSEYQRDVDVHEKKRKKVEKGCVGDALYTLGG